MNFVIYCSFVFQSLSGLCNCCDCFFGLRTSRKDRVLNESLFEYISDDLWEDVGIIESVDGFCVHHVDIVLFC